MTKYFILIFVIKKLVENFISHCKSLRDHITNTINIEIARNVDGMVLINVKIS